MSTPAVSPFVLVGDPMATACEGDVCAVPEACEQDRIPEDQQRALSPVAPASAQVEVESRGA
ncbi:hypothetical protein SAMN04488544_1362 [Microlunatus sagamiharensis]|uniref:Uncharacterized protein n=1 Tax=Microlunatus sagamiharensis TaxID=546874 RepID=A0A1H2M4C5_9ACTN|nr:hypothetical protein SAMN04488544_1362 [Microlunatus sagamiharensis]